MSAYQEGMLADRFAALAPEPLQGDWLAVQRRARRGRRRRMLTIAVAAALSMLVIASALGGRRVRDFFSTDPAPHAVVVQFDQSRRASLEDWGVTWPAVGSELRSVVTAKWRGGTSVAFAVAPARHGNGFCIAMFDLTTPRDGAAEQGCIGAKLRRSHGIIGQGALGWAGKDEHGENLGYHELHGVVTALRTQRLVLRYEDGKQDEVPITWVSKPIDAGFFAFDPAPEHFGTGHRASAFVAFDGDGREIARQSFEYEPGIDPGDPWAFQGMGGIGPRGGGWPRAVDRSTAHLVRFPGMPPWVRLTLALGKAGGRCYAIGTGSGGGCVKPGATPQCCDDHGAGWRGHAGWLTLVHGLAKDDWTVEFRYADGRVDVVRPREQVVLYAVPPRQYATGHWLESVVERDTAGRVVHRDEWSKEWAYFNFHRKPMRWPGAS